VGRVSRRDFLKLSTAGAGGGSLLLAAGLGPAEGASDVKLHKRIGEAYTICPYCSCGCGMVIATDETGHVINAEGDPDHIVNRGALDPKSIAVRQLSTSPLRLHKVMYRAPGSAEWEEKSWDWAIGEIASRMKKTRDESWVANVKVGDKDVPVNRTEGLALLGGAANNSEDCYLYSKLARALGVAYLEHQARI
jgi:anaerobic selenocysteine-containing dehydrogenase